MEGYFETTDSSAGTWFIDYSALLGKLYKDTIVQMPSSSKTSLVTGLIGSNGKATGPVKIVYPDSLDTEFVSGSILVCPVTTPNYIPLMQKAAAIITDQGGILSHAAIVAREMKKPCIVATENATKILKDGQNILVDADNGIVKAIE